MEFRVEPERVGRRGSRTSVVLVGLVFLAVVGFALATRIAPDSTVRPIAGASPDVVARDPAAAASVTATAAPSDDILAVEGATSRYRATITIVCNDASVPVCDRIATAATRSVIGRSSIRQIQVWTSLLCRDSVDCPSSRVVGTLGLGSAVVSFRSGLPDAWVNVVGPLGVGPRSSLDDLAWLIN